MSGTLPLDITSMIIDYEQGELSYGDTLLLFSTLIRTGMINSLQGHYGRAAEGLISQGVIDRDGEIVWDNYFGD